MGVAALASAPVLLTAFVANERRHSSPLVPLSIFRIKGLAAADVTQVVAQSGFVSLFPARGGLFDKDNRSG